MSTANIFRHSCIIIDSISKMNKFIHCRFDFEDEQIHTGTLLYLESRSEKEYVGKEVCLNCLPFLSKFPVDILGIRKCTNTHRKISEWNGPYICMVKNQNISRTVKENETITDLYLRKIEDSVKNKVQNTFCEDNLKGCGVDMMTGGSSTVAEILKVFVLSNQESGNSGEIVS